MSIDLHIHTTASDGDVDPITVVRMAAQAGLTVISIADHESTSGFYPAYREGQAHGITVIPAVELLTLYKNKEIHVLGCHNFPVDDGFRLIKDAGGIPVLAHPGLIKDDEIVEEICAKGIAGLER